MNVKLLLALLLVAVVVSPLSSSAQQIILSNATAHDVLALFGLPRGLLPASVKSYSYDPDDGRFTVELTKPCYLHFSILFYYHETVTGVLEQGSMTDMEGIELKKLFVWVPLTEIKARPPPSRDIELVIGFVSETKDAAEFEEVRPCEDNGGGCAAAGGNPKQLLLLQQPAANAAQS
uniref:DUF538 family protein n=1 Tax=Kalanchoe fedtschenkoi TaxID=63787 RepID=A0A7N0USE5_KALFE